MKLVMSLACFLAGAYAEPDGKPDSEKAATAVSQAADAPPRVVRGQPLVETVDKPYTIEFRLPGPDKPESLKPVKAVEVKVYRQLDAPGGAVWRIEGASESIRALFAEGTRSIWLEEPTSSASSKVRVDLPGPKLEPKVQGLTYPNFSQGLVPVLTVQGLTPGFLVRASTAPKGTKLGEPVFLSTEKGAPLRFADVTWRDDLAYIRLIVPFADDPEEERAYLFEVTNPDGSISERLRVDRKGDAFASDVEIARAAHWMPVDDQARVPSVLGLNAKEARRRLEQAGFETEILDAVALEPIRDLDDWKLIGLEAAPGAIMRRGQTLLATALPLDDKEAAQRTGGGSASIESFDPGDDWATVAIGSLLGREPRAQGIDESQAKDEDWGDSTMIAVRLTPILCIDPNLSPDDASALILTRRALETLRSRPDPDDLPGALGRALSIAVRDFEPKLFATNDMSEWPIAQLFEEIDSALEAKADLQERRDAVKAWRDSLSANANRWALDRNGDKRIADDIAVWRVYWLVTHKLYNPAVHTRVFPDYSAGPIAGAMAFSDVKLSADWLESEGEIAPLRETANVEIGRNDYIGSCLPSRIKMPDVIGKDVVEAHKILRANWLQMIVQGALECDFVESTKPGPGEWLAVRSDVEVSVLRPVPDLAGVTLERARRIVEGYKLKPVVEDPGIKSGDLVWAQTPRPNERVEPGEEVKIRAARKTPDLRNKRLPAAQEEARTAGFRADHAANLSPLDVVIDQTPAPGKPLGIGDPIKLSVQREAPDVTNLTFADARDQLAKWRLELDQASQTWIGHDEVKVFDQEPKAHTKILIAPNADSAQLSKVKLRPGKTAPNLINRPLEDAEDVIKRLDLDLKIEAGMIEGVPMKVVSQEPSANQVVELNAKISVKLKPTGVLVPKVTEMTVNEAKKFLARYGLQAEYPAKTWGEDVVTAQDPPPYAPGQPNWLPYGQKVRLTPQIVVPDLVRRNASSLMSLEKVEQWLRAWDLEPEHPWTELASLKEAGAVVIGQEPRPGARLAHGGKVKLEVRVPVPNLVNRAYGQAAQSLKLRDFDLKTNAEPLRGDVVAYQSPEPNKLVLPRTVVELTIQRQVPSLQGMTVERASRVLEDLKFQVEQPPQARAEDVLTGETDPPAGTTVEPGSPIVLGRAVTRVPDVIGKTVNEAKLLLDRESFPFDIPNGLEGIDRITLQNPPAGSSRERGSLVKIDAKVKVPNVLNLPIREALDQIADAPGDLRGFDEPKSSANDHVIDQYPRAGEWVRPRTDIVLTSGFQIPNLVGLDESEAKALLKENDIPNELRNYNRVPTNDQAKVDRRIVVGQSLKAGSRAARGKTLLLDVEGYAAQAAPVTSRRNRIE